MRVAIIAAPYPLEEFPSPPLGITYVAAAFEAAGCEVRIYDYIVSHYSKEKLSKQLDDFQPDAVGAGCVTMNFYGAQQIIRDVKNCNPDIVTMMGGPHVSFTAEETLRNYPEIDLIFIGESDDTIIEFAPVIKQKIKWRDIRGIAYRFDDEVVNNGKRDFIMDVDSLPMPARHLLPISRYRALGYPVSMITGRGCPHSCIFCLGRKMVGSKVRRRNPRLVLDEIQQIINLGFERINIADDLFASDTQRVKEICAGIKERNLKFIWSAFARVDTVNQEMFDVMASAGCDSISFGVESGNPEMLKRIKKGIKLEQVVQAVKMCQQSGMLAHASFMVGLPGETKETLNQTANFAASLNILFGYHYLAPFPGTTLCEKIGDYDLEILTRDWSKYDANDAIVKTLALQPQDIRDFVAVYEKAIDVLWQKMLDGYGKGTNSPLDDMRVEGHWRMNLTYKILKDDLIEKYGFIEHDLFEGSKDLALKELGRRITACTNVEARLVDSTLSDFANCCYLKFVTKEKGCNWEWA